MSPRKKKILRAVIEDYILNAEPVGSKMLTERRGMNLSPATIRNEMSGLEAMGYLEQPHTSAGRVPSPKGYRLYVDELMEEHRLTLAEVRTINASLHLRIQELDRLVLEATQFLSSLTQYTAYTLTPSTSDVRLIRFELFLAGADAFVVVVVTDAQAVKNKVARTNPLPTEEDLQRLTAALNRHLVGPLLREIGEELLKKARRDAGPAAGPAGVYMATVAEFLDEIREALDRRDVVLTGQSHILGHPEYRDILKARRLLEYLSDRREMTRLSMPESSAPVRFVIGPENVAEQLHDTSVVMASYHIGENLHGLIGVVGPTRMDYAKLASRMAYFAERLGRALSGDKDIDE
ncbi:MAG: heat-inducible transcriptional repressor HrcA [Oscillospiraceae bacterium]|nr:heat-inducible transcriptional repressor HrcA [Oscillospiraceae bacterium]